MMRNPATARASLAALTVVVGVVVAVRVVVDAFAP